MTGELPPLDMTVQVVALDLACRACWATIRHCPRNQAEVWAGAHRDPVVVQGHLLVNGTPQLWRRRRR